MNLIFDIGNTATKIAIFDGHKKILSLRTKQYSWDELKKIFSPYKIERAIVASVRYTPEFIIDLATLDIPYVHTLSYNSKLPFRIQYETPETLGADRIAAIAGACCLFPGQKVLVIDAGSAITYDFVSGKTFKGGNISPGISMRFKALNKFTHRLPLGSTTDKFNSLGINTLDAITAGVINGVIYEINEYIRTFEEKHKGINLVLTGGDAGYLKTRIIKKVNYMPDIVIEGLNYILEHNV
jgi:type III pantothenate kinase